MGSTFSDSSSCDVIGRRVSEVGKRSSEWRSEGKDVVAGTGEYGRRSEEVSWREGCIGADCWRDSRNADSANCAEGWDCSSRSSSNWVAVEV